MKNKLLTMNKASILCMLVFGLISQAVAQFKVVGYMPSWAGSASSIQYSKLTHINYAFALPNTNGTIKPIENPAKLQQIVSSAHAAGKKVLIAVGGWSEAGVPLDSRFEAIGANPTYRTNMVNDLINVVQTYNLDGVDVDWEYPDAGASASNYAALMNQLATAMHSRGKELSAAVGIDNYSGGGILPEVFNYVDHLNIMAYDATGDANHSTYNVAVNAINFWRGKGLPASKLILGVPFYARPSWNGFNVLLSQGANPNADVFGSDGYNGLPTIRNKTNLALQQAGGIMIWELSQDATGANSLLSAIDEVVKSTGTNNPPNVSISSPATTYNAPANITLNATATDADGSVTKVEFFNGATKLGEDATSPYSFVWSNVAAGTYSVTAKATDNKGATKTSTALSITVNGTVTQTPYSGSPYPIPGKIEAENFDNGGQNVAFNDVDAVNSGGQYRTTAVDIEATTDAGAGYNVGYVAAGEWLEYTVNVTAAGNYNFQFRVAAITAGKYFHAEINGQNVTGNVTVPNTGGWQNWQTVSINNVALTAGQKILKLAFDQPEFNLNYVQIVASGNPPNQAPTVSITGPANNSSYTAPATVSITANAADADGTVSKVEFFNGATKLGEDVTSPYSFNWTNVAAGTYSITARATDNAGAVTTSGAVNIVVNSSTNQPPTVSITGPANNSSYTAPATVSITANAADANGTVSKVEFFNGATKLGEDVTSPYSFNWTNVAAGTYSITARATDNAGAVTTSGAVNVVVNPPGTGCSTPAWNASSVYTPPNRVSRSGNIYEAKWWTQGDDPLLSGQWDVWKLIGPCNARIALNGTLDNTSANYITVGPNPSNGTLYVDMNLIDASTATITIFDSFGHEVYNISGVQSGDALNIRELGIGIYVMKISAGSQVLTQRIVLQ